MAAPVVYGEVKIALGMLLSAKDMKELGVDIDCLNDIHDYLFDYFVRIGMRAKNKFFPTVSWDFKPGDITDNDLVVYFVRNPGSGIIKNLGMTIPPDGGGLTALSGALPTNLTTQPPSAMSAVMKSPHGAISEVYVESNMPSVKLAKIALHELMHNKLQLDDKQLHRNLTLSVGQNHVQDTTIVSSTDVAFMAAGMGTPVKQYAAQLPGGVPTLFVGPPPPIGGVLVTDADGNRVGPYLSPAQRAAKGTVDWSRAVRVPRK